MLEYRSEQPEMMDDPKIDSNLLKKNLGELDILNRYFGGHAITLQGVKQLINIKRINRVVDLGCGSGDSLKYIADWARKNNVKAELIGVDMNFHAIQYLKKICIGFPEISGVVMDYNEYLDTNQQVDIFLCSLFCHHLNDTQLLELFSKLKRAKTGFIINDLHRSVPAYYSAWIFPRLFGGTVLSKNDGPVSVSRAFKREEIEKLFLEAGIKNYSIQWKWAFRYLVVVRNN